MLRLLSSLCHKDKYDPEAVAGELGKRFGLSKTRMKAYPLCTNTHSDIDAIYSLMREKGVTPKGKWLISR
ncbi:MAG: hypothetical protein JSW12_02340 [Deltaproteobacteria bacterium]|nr:MAG: hypothetical protein JSW12_02340 [Deltaproteobacteria bacterium]